MNFGKYSPTAKSRSCFCAKSQKVVALFAAAIYNYKRGGVCETVRNGHFSRVERLKKTETAYYQRRKAGRQDLAYAGIRQQIF